MEAHAGSPPWGRDRLVSAAESLATKSSTSSVLWNKPSSLWADSLSSGELPLQRVTSHLVKANLDRFNAEKQEAFKFKGQLERWIKQPPLWLSSALTRRRESYAGRRQGHLVTLGLAPMPFPAAIAGHRPSASA